MKKTHSSSSKILSNFYVKHSKQISNLEALTTTHYGSAADVFSFAISLFAILTCQKPYANILDKIPNQLLQWRTIEEKVCSGGRPEPLPDHPSGISAVLEKCWHQDPQKRPTMKKVAAILLNIKDIIEF